MHIDLRSKRYHWGKALHKIATISSHRLLCSAVYARRAFLTYQREFIHVKQLMMMNKNFTGASSATRILTMNIRG